MNKLETLKSCKCNHLHCTFEGDDQYVYTREGIEVLNVRRLTEEMLPKSTQCPLREALRNPFNK